MADNHAPEIVAVDFFTVPTVTFRVLYVLLVMSDARDERISTSVNVEIGQIAGGNCIGGEMQPYSDAIYATVADNLLAVMVAGVYPETTTHFAIDAAHRGHCDPRCFGLNYFYSVVAEKMGHTGGTRYGDAAKYGKKYGTHNVWWDDAVCGGAPRAL